MPPLQVLAKQPNDVEIVKLTRGGFFNPLFVTAHADSAFTFFLPQTT